MSPSQRTTIVSDFIVRTFFSYPPGHERREYDPSAPVSLPALRPGGVDVRERVEGCRMMPSVRGGNLFASGIFAELDELHLRTSPAQPYWPFHKKWKVQKPAQRETDG